MKDREIKRMLKEKSQELKIPDGIKPESIMEKLNIKTTQKNRHIKTGKIIWMTGTAMTVLAACLVLYFTGFTIRNSSKIISKSAENEISMENGREKLIDSIYKNSKEKKFSRYTNEIEENVVYDAEGDSSKNESTDDGYYKNNDQVNGVNESDTTINDGKHIYTVNDEKEVCVITTNGASVSIDSKINLNDAVNEDYGNLSDTRLYYYNNKLIVVTNYSEYNSYSPYIVDDEENTQDDSDVNSSNVKDNEEGYGNYIYVIQYDVSNSKEPELETVNKVEGDCQESRLSDGYLYIISYRYVFPEYYYYNEISDKKDYIDKNCIPRINDEEINCESIEFPDNNSYYNSGYEIVASFAVMEDKMEAVDVMATMGENYNLYASKDNIYTYSSEYGQYYVRVKTNITKYSYNKGKIENVGSTKINGDILNQFSLDEYKGYLRVVLTERDNNIDNTLIILDENLQEVNKIQNIANGEEIYSAKFDGDKCYFVTFRNTDPLFVADLSDVNNPSIISELKMTGYSDYLQLWGKDTLLGVGCEAETDGSQTGLKISLFDISNKTEVKELSKYTDRNAYIDNYDYKDMMIAPEKGLAGFNVNKYYDKSYDYKRKITFDLFYIDDNSIRKVLEFRYNDANGDEDEYYKYRGLYINNYLYIVTEDTGVSAIDLSDFSVKETEKFN